MVVATWLGGMVGWMVKKEVATVMGIVSMTAEVVVSWMRWNNLGLDVCVFRRRNVLL